MPSADPEDPPRLRSSSRSSHVPPTFPSPPTPHSSPSFTQPTIPITPHSSTLFPAAAPDPAPSHNPGGGGLGRAGVHRCNHSAATSRPFPPPGCPAFVPPLQLPPHPPPAAAAASSSSLPRPPAPLPPPFFLPTLFFRFVSLQGWRSGAGWHSSGRGALRAGSDARGRESGARGR